MTVNRNNSPSTYQPIFFGLKLKIAHIQTILEINTVKRTGYKWGRFVNMQHHPHCHTHTLTVSKMDRDTERGPYTFNIDAYLLGSSEALHLTHSIMRNSWIGNKLLSNPVFNVIIPASPSSLPPLDSHFPLNYTS